MGRGQIEREMLAPLISVTYSDLGIDPDRVQSGAAPSIERRKSRPREAGASAMAFEATPLGFSPRALPRDDAQFSEHTRRVAASQRVRFLAFPSRDHLAMEKSTPMEP